jgi:hypothetical protein
MLVSKALLAVVLDTRIARTGPIFSIFAVCQARQRLNLGINVSSHVQDAPKDTHTKIEALHQTLRRPNTPSYKLSGMRGLCEQLF